jgi:RNA-splicing ligase RtcB
MPVHRPPETCWQGRLDATLAEIYARVPVGMHSQPAPVDADAALAQMGGEAPFAYKDIETVMAASADLVCPTKRLTPLRVFTG